MTDAGCGVAHRITLHRASERRVAARTSPTRVDDASNFSKTLLWVSAINYAVGFFVAFVLGPILTRLDRG